MHWAMITPETLFNSEKPWGIVSVAALGAGALDQDRTLVLVADANKALYTCIYTVSKDSGEACNQSFSLPATPISLLVQPLDKSGLGQVVALVQAPSKSWQAMVPDRSRIEPALLAWRGCPVCLRSPLVTWTETAISIWSASPPRQ
jgi:hypothetical protein